MVGGTPWLAWMHPAFHAAVRKHCTCCDRVYMLGSLSCGLLAISVVMQKKTFQPGVDPAGEMT